MAPKSHDSREMGRYAALAQVGFEMVAPIVLGLWLDHKFEIGPWGVIVGAVLGLVGGLAHLVVMVRRFEAKDSPPRRDAQ
jgi:F0F1-type ATP synthase assembly protein I